MATSQNSSSDTELERDDYTLTFPQVQKILGVGRRTVQRYKNEKSPYSLSFKEQFIPDGGHGDTKINYLFSESEVEAVRQRRIADKQAVKGRGDTMSYEVAPVSENNENSELAPLLSILNQLSDSLKAVEAKDEQINLLNQEKGELKAKYQIAEKQITELTKQRINAEDAERRAERRKRIAEEDQRKVRTIFTTAGMTVSLLVLLAGIAFVAFSLLR